MDKVERRLGQYQLKQKVGEGGNGLAQGRNAHHRRVLVRPGLQRLFRNPPDIVRSIVVGKALAQIDRLMLDGEPGHHFENRSPVP